jgi:hypothetical protein
VRDERGVPVVEDGGGDADGGVGAEGWFGLAAGLQGKGNSGGFGGAGWNYRVKLEAVMRGWE